MSTQALLVGVVLKLAEGWLRGVWRDREMGLTSKEAGTAGAATALLVKQLQQMANGNPGPARLRNTIAAVDTWFAHSTPSPHRQALMAAAELGFAQIEGAIRAMRRPATGDVLGDALVRWVRAGNPDAPDQLVVDSAASFHHALLRVLLTAESALAPLALDLLADLRAARNQNAVGADLQRLLDAVGRVQASIDHRTLPGDILHAALVQLDQALAHTAAQERHPALYVRRRCDGRLRDLLARPRAHGHALLVAGPRGSGKTFLLEQLARELSARSRLALFLGVEDLAADLDAAVHRRLQLASAPLARAAAFAGGPAALHALSLTADVLGHDAVLLIDGIEESPAPDVAREHIQELVRATAHLRVRVVVSHSATGWNTGPGWRAVGATRHLLVHAYSPQAYAEALDRLQRTLDVHTRPVGPAEALCHHPSLLRLFCEAQVGRRGSGSPSLHQADLLRLLVTAGVNRAARLPGPGPSRDHLAACLVSVAGHTPPGGPARLPLHAFTAATRWPADPIDTAGPLARLLRAQLLTLDDTGPPPDWTIGFPLPGLRTHLYARARLARWRDTGAPFATLTAAPDLQAADRATLRVAILRHLRSQGSVDWNATLSGGPHWVRAACAALSQLPSDAFGPLERDFLTGLLMDTGVDVVADALDVAKQPHLSAYLPTSAWTRIAGLTGLADGTPSDALCTNPPLALQRRAVLALRGAPVALALPLLAAATGHYAAPIRQNAARALLEHGTPAVDLLIGQLGDAPSHIRARAARSLGAMATHRRTASMTASLARAVAPCLANLDHPSAQVRTRCAEALSALPTLSSNHSLRTHLIRALADRQAPVRAAAVHALATLLDPRVAPALSPLLNDRSRLPREATLHAIEVLKLPGFTRRVSDILDESTHRSERCAAAGALAHQTDSAGLRALVRGLAADDDRVAAACAQAIRPHLATPSVGPRTAATVARLLDDALASEHFELRFNAACALATLASHPKLGQWAGPRRTVERHRDGPARDALAQALSPRRNRRARRAAAARAVGQLNPNGAAALLRPRLEDRAPQVRAASAAALGHLTAASMAPDLLLRTHDLDPAVRAAASAALKTIGSLGRQ